MTLLQQQRIYWQIGSGEDVAYYFYDRELAEWFNATREEILKILSSICREAGLRELYFRKRTYRW